MPTAILTPTSNVSVAWTPYPSGTNYQTIDETSYSDSDFNYGQWSPPSYGRDTFEFSNLPSEALGVTSVKIYWRLRNYNPGTGSAMYCGVDIGGTSYIRMSGTYTGSFQTVTDTMTVSPATSASFTVSEVNAMRGWYQYTPANVGEGGEVSWMQWEVTYTVGGGFYVFLLS